MTIFACIARLRAALLQTALWVSLSFFLVQTASADNYAEVNRLLKAGQPAEAMAKVDQSLADKPRDPQLRFLKGVIFAETGKTTEAIAAFVKLTEDFPELPEPYNNLAVLYAAQGQLEKSRVALEMAIRTSPSYSTAHENLGDVYAKLASQAYSKALQIDSSNAGLTPKLALIRNLFPADARNTRTATLTSASTASSTAVMPPRTVNATSLPTQTAVVVAPTPAPAPAPAPALVPVPASAPGNGSPNAATGVAQPDRAQNVGSAVQAWAKAWSNKDLASYFAAYSSRFEPQGNQTRKEWEAERKERIMSRGSISVSLSDLDIDINGSKAVVTFRQSYRAQGLTANARKSLNMRRESGRWLIVEEKVVN